MEVFHVFFASSTIIGRKYRQYQAKQSKQVEKNDLRSKRKKEYSIISTTKTDQRFKSSIEGASFLKRTQKIKEIAEKPDNKTRIARMI